MVKLPFTYKCRIESVKRPIGNSWDWRVIYSGCLIARRKSFANAVAAMRAWQTRTLVLQSVYGCGVKVYAVNQKSSQAVS